MNHAPSGFIDTGPASAGFTHNTRAVDDIALHDHGDTADPAILDGGH